VSGAPSGKWCHKRWLPQTRHGVELIGEDRLEIMAQEYRFPNSSILRVFGRACSDGLLSNSVSQQPGTSRNKCGMNWRFIVHLRRFKHNKVNKL